MGPLQKNRIERYMNDEKNGYSLKEIADEIGINKMKVYRFVKSNNITERYTNAQTKYYDETVKNLLIKELSDDRNDTSSDTKKQMGLSKEDVYNLLENQIKQQIVELEQKNHQIKNKDKQLEKMQELLSQQQQLSLHDKNLIQKYEDENKELRLLIESNSNSEQEKKESSYIQEENTIVPPKKAWWKLWN